MSRTAARTADWKTTDNPISKKKTFKSVEDAAAAGKFEDDESNEESENESSDCGEGGDSDGSSRVNGNSSTKVTRCFAPFCVR
jgi:Mg-chelatase subunit ChlI